LRFAYPLFVLSAMVASCERPNKLEDTRRDVDNSLPAVTDAAASIVDTASNPPIPTPPTIAPAQQPAAVADTGSVATPAELAELSARLDVPVQGVMRSQLHDTYTEPRAGHVHEALDILAARGTPVLSATDGRLLKLFNSKPGGLMVYATDASERFILLYGHLDRYAEGVSNGMRLERGQVIGYVGTTGNAPPGTPHLHFGILRGHPNVSWSSGIAVNPYPLLLESSH